MKRGLRRVEKALDVVTLVRTQKRLRALENHLFSMPQRMLLRMNRHNFLNGSSSTSSEDEYPNFDLLEGYKIKSQVDKTLLRDTFPSIKRTTD
jgi:hypothetical protein